MNANYRVIESTAIVRRRPSLEHPIVKKFALGSIIQVIGTLPTGWLQVAKAGEPIGWVHGDSLSKETVIPDSLRPFDTTVKADSTPPLIIITSHKSDRDIKVIENLSSARITG